MLRQLQHAKVEPLAGEISRQACAVRCEKGHLKDVHSEFVGPQQWCDDECVLLFGAQEGSSPLRLPGKSVQMLRGVSR